MKKFFSNILVFLKKKKKWVAIIAIILIAAVYFGRGLLFKNGEVSYQTAKVEKGTIISSISSSGQIVAVGNITLNTQASGLVKNIFVKNGDTVSQNQNILEMTLDQAGVQRQTQAWASYLSAKNSLLSAEASLYSLQSEMFGKWKTYMDLAQSSSYENPDKSPRTDQRQLPQFYQALDDWLATEAKYKNQQGVIAQAQAQVASTWATYQTDSPMIAAPISGVVSDITLQPGMAISNTVNATTNVVSSQKIATIHSESLPIAQFNVSEIDVGKIKEGNKATITLDALSGKTFTGVVTGVDRTGVVSSGVTNYPLTINFDTNDNEILPNMSVTANIITATRDNVLLVPASSIQTVSGSTYVRVMKNNQVIQVQVETGLSSDTQTEIVSGVSEGDSVVTSVVSNNQSSGSSPFSSRFGGGGGQRAIFGR